MGKVAHQIYYFRTNGPYLEGTPAYRQAGSNHDNGVLSLVWRRAGGFVALNPPYFSF